jgi:hypothetical protein
MVVKMKKKNDKQLGINNYWKGEIKEIRKACVSKKVIPLLQMTFSKLILHRTYIWYR